MSYPVNHIQQVGKKVVMRMHKLPLYAFNIWPGHLAAAAPGHVADQVEAKSLDQEWTAAS
jgi:hypothetical protein